MRYTAAMQSSHEMRHLYRSNTNKVLAGVCGGLGEYWNIDPVLVRLLWILASAFTGFVPGTIAYILAVVIIPAKPKPAT